MTWNNASHNFFFPICGIINYIFVRACRDKFTCYEKKKLKKNVKKNVLIPQITFLLEHVVTNLHAMKKIN